MSHFSVMVVGEEPEAQLAPYHEFECTGDDDQYVQDIDITADVRERAEGKPEDWEGGGSEPRGLTRALSYHGLDERIVSDESEVERKEKHKYGYAVVKEGKLIKAVNRTNPNKKWDWYVLGGRWNGFFLLKNGERSNQARHGDVDFRGMRDQKAAEARKRYEMARAALGDAPEPRTWDSIREEHAGNIDAARNAFHAQDAYVRARKVEELTWASFDAALHEFYWPIERYIDRARRIALAPFALVRDGNWYERGRMGWFGCVADKKDQGDWLREVDALLESLPTSTLLSLYDCHI